MKPISTILYEVGSAEIAALPVCYTVLQYNTESKRYGLLQAHIDYFPIMKKFKYFLFQAPPLPTTQSFTESAVEVQR